MVTARRGLTAPSARLVLLVVLLAGALLLARELSQGWYPHDEGVLGQSADRVLNGEIPHRDFDETYTGLLSYLNAAVFAVFGISSWVLRLPLFAAALLWLAAMYRILLRFAPPLGAGVVALAALSWSVTSYPAPLPSWYILFASTFGALALVRWHESGRRHWLVIAGAAGGIAFLFKLTGIFFFLGAGLALIAASDGDPIDGDARHPTRGPFAWIVAATLVVVVLALDAMVGRNGDRALLRFALPTTLLALAIASRVWTPVGTVDSARWRALAGRVVPFAIGGLVPIASFLAAYALVGGLPALVEGVFVTPFRRVAFAALQPPPIVSLFFAAPLALLLWIPSSRGRMRSVLSVITGLAAVAVLVGSATDRRLYSLGWFSAWGLLFVAAIEGARLALVPPADAGGREGAGGPTAATRRGRVALTLACIAVGSALVEYPFAAPIYTLYALPLSMIAVTAGVAAAERTALVLQFTVAGFFLLFGVLRIVPGSVDSLGHRFIRSQELATLALPRSGLRIGAGEATEYATLVRFVQEKAAGRPLWAGPDAPEVYFLTGLPNRTRTMFDFLDAPAVTARPLIDRLDDIGASIVVLKLRPQFSPPVSAAMRDSLRSRFPQQRAFPGFLVLWR